MHGVNFPLHNLARDRAPSAMALLPCSLKCATTQRVFFLSLLLYHADSLSFRYDSINTTNKVDFGALGDDCNISDHRADLTSISVNNYTNNIGRLVYPEPMQLWDAATGETASFTTTFSFGMDAVPGQPVGHGMAFFLTSQVDVPSSLPAGSYGGYLGLFSPGATGGDQVVAVEFDTFRDEWDPSDHHIGVDLNNISSFGSYTTLPNDSFVGRVMSARIDYNSGTGQLDVMLHNGSSDGATHDLSVNVDLRSFLPEQVIVGFSAATNSERVALHYVLSWSFDSSLPLVANSSHKSQPRRTAVPLVAGVTAATVLALLLSTAVGVLLWRSRRQEQSAAADDDDEGDDPWPIDEDLESGSGPRPFQLSKLTAATRNFSEETKLGQGASGSVYRGRVDELDVAIKVFSRGGSAQGKREYTAEVTVISRLRHRNLVHLIGWCDGRKKLLLVYELVPNGSLDRHLYGASAVLPWPARYKIILGLGAAVLYLHEEWGQCVVHGDIKPSNIMLDESFGAKLGDFGLARLIDHGVGLQTMTAVAGTPGYLDPECIATGKASAESDVYSFGVVLLEVATGRRPMAPPPPGDTRIFRLVEWAWGMYGRGAVLDAADEALCGQLDAREVELVLVIGLWCAHPDARARPSIREAVEVLRSGMAARVPALPPRMPVAMYVQPYDPTEKHAADEASKTSGRMSSHDYGRHPPAADDYQTLSTTSSIPPVGSKQSVRLLSGR
ncbi:hypothetical protein ACQJBY_037269 [Aegilops geniculata]